jgi:hypothetical protein
MADSGSRTAATGNSQESSEIRTVGQLRAALDGVPDDTPLIVNAADPEAVEFIDEQMIIGAGFGRIDWGDGRGLVRDTVLGLNCRRAGWAELDSVRKHSDRSLDQDEGAGR